MTSMVPINEIERMAESVAKSGLFGIKTKEQAIALMLVAQAEGAHPAQAARDYHVIQGKPALKADAMLARFQAAGGSVEWISYNDKIVSGIFSHSKGGKIEIEWTMDRAKAAGLTGKQVWKQYPRQMLRARVISEGIKTVYPGVAIGVYTPEEVTDFDTSPPPIKAEAVEIKLTADDLLPRIADAGCMAEMKAIAADAKTLSEDERLKLREPYKERIDELSDVIDADFSEEIAK